jgi:hypothetical protein
MPMSSHAKRRPCERETDEPLTRRRGLDRPRLLTLLVIASMAAPAFLGAAPKPSPSSWKDDTLVASYEELVASGELEAAIRNPARPGEAPQAAFLEALAWFAAGMPGEAGTLTLAQLDEFVDNQVWLYEGYLQARAEEGAENDYPRTRTWKVIQKFALLRDEMVRSPFDGTYDFPALHKATSANDPWERAHTVSSAEDFRAKVCERSKERPVLVKFGNTNCTQCMLFELTGSIKDFAETEDNRDAIDVYKVWWGLPPDSSFAGRIQDPTRLDDLAEAEGVRSSPYFIVYHHGRRYPCGGAFPDAQGSDEELQSCLMAATGDAPLATACRESAS